MITPPGLGVSYFVLGANRVGVKQPSWDTPIGVHILGDNLLVTRHS